MPHPKTKRVSLALGIVEYLLITTGSMPSIIPSTSIIFDQRSFLPHIAIGQGQRTYYHCIMSINFSIVGRMKEKTTRFELQSSFRAVTQIVSIDHDSVKAISAMSSCQNQI
mmetsp:Transcript_8962/g.21320  ORF Transcript_8962/g.21320 Transcript_8962/m.21320 type:complete len:111 (+) Transcript_8962:1859-2191(+)